MMKRAALVAVLFTASATAAGAAPVLRHAGEYQTIIDNGAPRVVCFPTDAVLDQNYLMRSMAKIRNAQCKVGNISSAGAVTTYTVQCDMGGSVMTTTAVFTVTGPDSFSSKAHSHGGAMKLADGRVMAVPDTTIVTVSRRLGPCKPGDRQVTN